MRCMHKNRLNFSDLSSDHACRILAGWLAGWLVGSGKPGSNGLEMISRGKVHDSPREGPRSCDIEVEKRRCVRCGWLVGCLIER